ncbi:MAG: hypothetical protein JWO05_1805 [Gemmatimonadetes bacterium]|nr:hypothetical protein [Gemmatimonadota bacterium]
MNEDDREDTYQPAWWVPGPNLRTLWPFFFRDRRLPPHTRWELEMPDGDRVELYRVQADPRAPRLILLHGLEGSLQSHYLGPMLAEASRAGWGADLLMFGGCGTPPNRAKRFYHSGETSDIHAVAEHLYAEFPSARFVAAGYSLGANVLLKWLGEQGQRASARIAGAVAVSTPFDLARGARHIPRIYDRRFVKSLRAKALAKLALHPGAFDEARLRAARTIWDFDDTVTAPVHGFGGASDYYARSSSIHFLSAVRVPTLLLSARDDPFLPEEVLAEVEQVARGNPFITTEFPAVGGHVGFVSGRRPWRPQYWAERRVRQFLEVCLRA